MSLLAFAGRSRLQPLRQHLTVQRKQLSNPPSKRPSSSSSKPEPPASPSSKENGTAAGQQQTYRTIPGPSWAWIEPLTAPFRAYGRMQARSPLRTQLSSTLTIYFLGDLSAQLVSARGRQTDSAGEDEGVSDGSKTSVQQQHAYEPIRGLRALVIGGIASIPSYKWFLFLGDHFNYRHHITSLCVKILVNQTFFTPVFNTYFFGMQTLLAGGGMEEAWRRVRDTVPVSWRNSWKVWPAVTAFSFTFVAPQFRSVFAGVVAIGWQTYLSWLNMRAARQEMEMGKA